MSDMGLLRPPHSTSGHRVASITTNWRLASGRFVLGEVIVAGPIRPAW